MYARPRNALLASVGSRNSTMAVMPLGGSTTRPRWPNRSNIVLISSSDVFAGRFFARITVLLRTAAACNRGENSVIVMKSYSIIFTINFTSYTWPHHNDRRNSVMIWTYHIACRTLNKYANYTIERATKPYGKFLGLKKTQVIGCFTDKFALLGKTNHYNRIHTVCWCCWFLYLQHIILYRKDAIKMSATKKQKLHIRWYKTHTM